MYASIYPVVIAAPFVAASLAALRKFFLRGWAAALIVFPFYVLFPFRAEPRPFTPASWIGRALMIERGWDFPGCALPSFHVLWAFIAASVYAERWPSTRRLWWGWVILIAASCIATSAHAILDVAAAGLLLPLIAAIPGRRA